MADSPPSDVKHHVRLLPDGKVPPVTLEPGQRHQLVVHVEGDEDPQAMTPEAAEAEGGVSLPKLGEKFSVNTVMGSATGSISFPVPPGRTLTPGLGLGYDSNGESGPFGLGWALSVPYFQRATTRPHLGQSARGVPTYDNAAESDVFIYSDAAELLKAGPGEGQGGYNVTRYRPRLEGGFSRIERWEKDGISHWRVTNGANIVSIFGFDAASRVADPEDETHVFRWNLSAQIDPLGNTVVYQYATDTEVEEGRAPGCQSVLVRVLYGNREPPGEAFPVVSEAGMEAVVGGAPDDFLFEVLLDWESEPGSGDVAQKDPAAWFVRPDPFSSGRAGFEVRTRRLCRAVRVVHRLGGETILASRTELSYDLDEVAARLTEVKHIGIGEDGSELAAPARGFVYTEHAFDPQPRELPAFEGLDLSKKKTDAELIDLDGRAIAGLLVRHLGSFSFFRRVDASTNAPAEPLGFGASVSSSQDAHRQRFFDLDLNGRPALVELGPGGVGQAWERNADDDGWASGVVVASVPPEADFDVETGFPRVLWGDLDGDGRTDALVVPAKGAPAELWRFEGLERGWEPAETPKPPADAAAVLDDPDACVLLVDVSGDGLPDLLHLEQGKATLWPCLGHGKFGKGLSLPVPDTTLPTHDGVAGPAVDPRRIRAFDVQGTGGVDLMVVGDGVATLWLGEGGNGFVERTKTEIPPFDELALSSLTRIEGRATGSFVFAKKEANATLTAVDFFAGELGDVRQMLLAVDENNIGLQVFFTYAPSTSFEPSPEEASPVTRLPFCVPVVTAVESYDHVSEVYTSSKFTYRHGSWDPREREFRGFGFVEQGDAEDMALLAAMVELRSKGKTESVRQSYAIEDALPRMFTRSWFHTGVVLPGGTTFTDAYASEFNLDYDPSVVTLTEPGDGDPEVARALKGMALRTESYFELRPSLEVAADSPETERAVEVATRPVSISVHGYQVKTVMSGADHPCLLTVPEQSLSYAYERKDTPDPRVSHSAVLEVDDFGLPRKTIEVAYPRRQAVPEPTLPLGPVDPFGPPGGSEEDGGVRARLVGVMFDEAKSFVLPDALPGLRAARAVHQERAGAEVVVVGHTDTEGQPDDNAALSLARARTVAALFAGDAQIWLGEYEAGGVGKWGAVEDDRMSLALGHTDFDAFGVSQAAGLGLAAQRLALIEQYFQHAAAGLPAGASVLSVGAGESFLAVPTADDTAEPANRRVELFFFDTDAEPAVPASTLGKNDGTYDAWSGSMGRTVKIDVQTGGIDDPSGPSSPNAGPEAPPDADLTTSEAPTDDPQLRTEVVRSEVVTVFHEDKPDHYRVGAVAETRSFAVSGQSGDSTAPFSMGALRSMGGGELLSHGRTYFFDDDAAGPSGGNTGGAPSGVGRLGLVHSSHTATFTQGQFDAAFSGDALAKERLDDSPYIKDAGLYWAPSGVSEHDPDRFFVAVRAVDVFGNAAVVGYDDDVYFATSGTDALGNTVVTEFDTRTLAAKRVVDANGVESHVRFDALGRATKTWAFGVEGEGSTEDEPAARFEYDLESQPVSVTTHTRHEHINPRKHKHLPEPKVSAHEHTSVTYYSGAGQALQTRVKIEGERYRVGGHQVVNNKGKSVLAFDPTEGGVGYGVASGDPVKRVQYDDFGRPVRVEYRDGTVERSEFDAWGEVVFDRNDTAEEEGLEVDLDEQEKADLARHAGTGSHVRLDVVGRPYASFTELRDDKQHRMLSTRVHFDAAGNTFETIDAGGRVAEKRRFGLGGLQLQARSVDGGVQASVPNVDGSVLYARRGPVGSGHGFYSSYDALRRPVSDFVVADSGGAAAVVKHRVWVDTEPTVNPGDAVNGSTYHRGRLLRVYDGGGLQSFLDYDHQGNGERAERVLPANPTSRPNWAVLVDCTSVAELDGAASDLLESKRNFGSSAQFDANGRLVQSENAHGAKHLPEYTEEGRLLQVSRIGPEDGDETVIQAVEGYDIFGRPTAVKRGKSRTAYSYDPTTQRLASVTSKAGSKTLQALSYVYDPAGNILRVRDDAHKTVATGGESVAPVTRYRYDTLYRLIEASGREHHGQVSPGRGSVDTVPQRNASPNDVTAVRNYTQRYDYDVHGNLLELRHQLAARHSAGAWTRRSEYSSFGNRLRASAIGKTPTPELYEHDELGRMSMPHLDEVEWDEFDQLCRVRRGTTEVFFQYADGVRVRKWTVKGGRTEERVYAGGVEEYRSFLGGDPLDEDKVIEQTHTEHAPGGLTLDTKLRRDRKAVASPKPLFRYRLGNHLGSTSLEVDEDGGVVSYEEYHPYGTTSYRAVRSGIDVDVNRYRFTGMERDEETGLAQHGARYYVSWLGRWMSADPIGLGGGANRYRYCSCNPVDRVDRDGTDERLVSERVTYAYEGESYIDFSDAEAGPSVTPHGRDMDGDPIVSLAVPNADPGAWFEEAQANAAHDQFVMDTMAERVNAGQAKGFGWMMTYTMILMMGASGGGVIAAGSTMGRGAAFLAFAFDADQLQAAARSDWTGEVVHSGFHDSVAYTAIGLGTKVETAHSIATGAEIGAGLIQMAPAFVAVGRTVKTAAQRLASQRGMIKVGPDWKWLTDMTEALGPPKKTTRLPQDGTWSGAPGDSTFFPSRSSKLPHPDNPRVVDLNPGEGIPFRKGRADFSKQAVDEFDVPGLNGSARDRTTMAEGVAKRYGLVGARGRPTASEGLRYMERLGLVPHHAGGMRVQLVPHGVHGSAAGRIGVPHAGGASDLRGAHGIAR